MTRDTQHRHHHLTASCSAKHTNAYVLERQSSDKYLAPANGRHDKVTHTLSQIIVFSTQGLYEICQLDTTQLLGPRVDLLGRHQTLSDPTTSIHGRKRYNGLICHVKCTTVCVCVLFSTAREFILLLELTQKIMAVARLFGQVTHMVEIWSAFRFAVCG